MIELYDKCPRMNTCSAPKCPLDSQYHKRSARLKGEESCGMCKRIRLQIVSENPGYGSPFEGYTGMEWAGTKSYTQSYSEETRSRGCLGA